MSFVIYGYIALEIFYMIIPKCIKRCIESLF